MQTAAYVSFQLARFGHLRAPGAVDAGDRPGLMFCSLGADTRAAGTDPATQEAFTFLVLGLHETEVSADGLLADAAGVVPWFVEAEERWSGVLAPYRTRGTANLLLPETPAALFDPVASAPPAATPVAALTSVGWIREGLDIARVQDFGLGVGAVRASMTGVPGLHSQQTFVLPGGIALDPVTVSFWDREADMLAWAYRPGSHRRQLDRYQATANADRTSFTRLAILRSSGTWYGQDPRVNAAQS